MIAAVTPSRVVSPYAPPPRPSQAAAPSVALDTFTPTPSVAPAPAPAPHLGRSVGVAVALGLTMLGVAAPAAAQTLRASAVSQSQATRGAVDVDAPPRPLPTDTLPPSPLPEPRPARPEATHMFTGAENHVSFGTLSQRTRDARFNYGELDVGRTFTLDLERGGWHSQTTLDASVQGRAGYLLDPGQGAGNITGGITLGQNLSRELGGGFSAYGRASVGIQGGFGTRFDEDEPLHALRLDGGLGLQYSNGLTTVYGEVFGERVTDLGRNPLGHDRVGARIGAQHLLTERDALNVELNASRYRYTDGTVDPAVGASVGWLHRSGSVWWGPQVGVEHRGSGDNHITAGIRVEF